MEYLFYASPLLVAERQREIIMHGPLAIKVIFKSFFSLISYKSNLTTLLKNWERNKKKGKKNPTI